MFTIMSCLERMVFLGLDCGYQCDGVDVGVTWCFRELNL